MSTSKALTFVTPVGRIVGGDPWTAQDKDAAGQPLTVKSGPNTGQPRVEFYVALAVIKTDPGLADLFALITQAAREGFPEMFDAQGNCTNPAFAFKFVDGDSTKPNNRNVTPNSREGYPGHYVFSFSTGYQPKRVTQGGQSEILDQTQIKRGDYVRLSGTVVGNGSPQVHTAGIFLNWNIVEFQASGEAINYGPDPKAVFGGAQPTLPVGAQVVAAAAPGILGTFAQPTVASGASGQPMTAPVTQPGAPISASMPQPAVAPQPAPAPHPAILTPRTLDQRLTPKAGEATWQQMLDAGWTEVTAIAEGMLYAENDISF